MEKIKFPVNVQNLYEGQLIKNYKEMCNILNEEVISGGNSKKAQEKEWKRYFDFEKVGQKYIITEIYNEPLPKDDGRSKGINNIYLKHIEFLLLSYLYKQNDKQASFTIRDMFILLGMSNTNYMNKEWKCDDDQITEFQINHFNQRSYKKLNRILFDALNNLKNRRLIDYSEDRMILIDEYGTKHWRSATNEEKDRIREMERRVLKEFGLESMIQVHLKFLSEDFYERVKELLISNYGIHQYYKQINLRFTHEHVYEALNETKEKIREERKSLNNKVIDYMNDQIPKIIERTEEKYNERIQELIDNSIGKPCPSKVKNIFRIQDEELYRYAQEKLAEYLLRI